MLLSGVCGTDLGVRVSFRSGVDWEMHRVEAGQKKGLSLRSAWTFRDSPFFYLSPRSTCLRGELWPLCSFLSAKFRWSCSVSPVVPSTL